MEVREAAVLGKGAEAKMICEKCHGKGLVYSEPHDRAIEIIPCDACGGCGFAHCCDGERAQPERNDDYRASPAMTHGEMRQ